MPHTTASVFALVLAMHMVAARHLAGESLLLKGVTSSPPPRGLKMGLYLPSEGSAFVNSGGESDPDTYGGFEIEIAKQIVFNHLGDEVDEIRRITHLEDRITFLANGTLDFVIGSFGITAHRKTEVDFVYPCYYSAATVLFAPGGVIEGVGGWEDLRNKTVAIRDGYYALDELVDAYGFIPLLVDHTEEAEELIFEGEAVAFIDVTNIPHENLSLVTTANPILPVPFAIAVRKGNTQLASRLSKAMMDLVQGNQGSDIIRIEKHTIGEHRIPPNPDLQALIADPEGDTFLNPKVH